MINRQWWTLTILLLFVFVSGNLQTVSGQDPLKDKFTYLPLLFNKYDPAWEFLAPVKTQLQPLPYSNPFLVIDSSGRPHLIWDTYPSEQAFIYHSYLTNQGWTPPAPIAQTLGKSKLLNPPVVGSQNQIYLVWYNELNLSGPYRLMYAAWNGTSWGAEYELLGAGKSNSINGMVRLDSQAVPNIAYLDSDGWFTTKIYYRKWTGSSFSVPQQVTRPLYASYIWLDNNSGLRFFGDDGYNQVHYSYWKNGAFLVNNRSLAGKINSRNALLDSQNNLHLLRLASVPVPGGNVTGVYQQCLKNNLTWSSEQVLSGQNEVQKYLLSFDDTLQPIVAWSRNDSTLIEVTFWNGCTHTEPKELSLPIIPDSTGWGDLVAVAKNTKASKVCFLSKEKYSGDTYWLTCTQ